MGLGKVFDQIRPGHSGPSILRALSSVDLPEPDGPMMATNSPSEMCMSMVSRAGSATVLVR
jgi:hypothetical protein